MKLLALLAALACAACNTLPDEDTPLPQVDEPASGVGLMTSERAAVFEKSSALATNSSLRMRFRIDYNELWDWMLGDGSFMGQAAPADRWVCPKMHVWVANLINNETAYEFRGELDSWATSASVVGPAQQMCTLAGGVDWCEYLFNPIAVSSTSRVAVHFFPTVNRNVPGWAWNPANNYTLPSPGTYTVTKAVGGIWDNKPYWRHNICEAGWGCAGAWYYSPSANQQQCSGVANACHDPCWNLVSQWGTE